MIQDQSRVIGSRNHTDGEQVHPLLPPDRDYIGPIIPMVLPNPHHRPHYVRPIIIQPDRIGDEDMQGSRNCGRRCHQSEYHRDVLDGHGDWAHLRGANGRCQSYRGYWTSHLHWCTSVSRVSRLLRRY
jgi:hypothetical protein